jgi:hypothetical protein
MPRVGAAVCVRVGLIHQRTFQAHSGTRLLCVCDRLPERAQQRARLLGVKW